MIIIKIVVVYDSLSLLSFDDNYGWIYIYNNKDVEKELYRIYIQQQQYFKLSSLYIR